jgi:hypothetical protein
VDRSSLVLDTESAVFILKCVATLESRCAAVASETAAKLFCRAILRAGQFVKSKSPSAPVVLGLITRVACNTKLLALAGDEAVAAVTELCDTVLFEAGTLYYSEIKDKAKSSALKVWRLSMCIDRTPPFQLFFSG